MDGRGDNKSQPKFDIIQMLPSWMLKMKIGEGKAESNDNLF